MFVYELLPKLVHLTLTGQDDEGNLEFTGTRKQWIAALTMEDELSGIE